MNLSIAHLLYANPSKDLSEKDYYPGGMVIPERNFSYENYGFGFNGKQKDDQVKGSGNSYDYGFRIYDPRIGKFLSLDPLFQSFPWYSPYQFAGNTPIQAVDLDGLEILGFMTQFRSKLVIEELRISHHLEIQELNNKYSGDYGKMSWTKFKLEEAMGKERVNNMETNLTGIQAIVFLNDPLVAQQIIHTPVDQSVIYDKDKQNLYGMMGQKTEMEDNQYWDVEKTKQRYEKMQMGNPKPGVLNSVAYSIEEVSKYAFKQSPVYKTDLGYKDFNNIKNAHSQAFNAVEARMDILLSNIENTGWDKSQFLSDVINFVAEGKYPESNDNSYNSYVSQTGRAIINLDNNQQIQLNVDNE
jgi:RHS repeat-associated protein